MNKSTGPRAAIPGHVIALSALAALAALLAYALYDRANSGQPLRPEQPRTGEISRIDLEAWAKTAQQKVLGTGERLTAGVSIAAPSDREGPDFTAAAPMRRTVTHVGVSPRRSETTRWAATDAPPYAGPSLASLPPPGD